MRRWMSEAALTAALAAGVLATAASAASAAGVLATAAVSSAEAPAGPAPAPARAGGSEDLPSEARRMEKAMRGVNGVKAEFVQIRNVQLTGEEIQAQGTLAYEPPQKFRLAYTTPEPQELVIRGDSLWVILPSENQAQRYPFSADAPGSEIFLLFGGRGRSLGDAYHVTQEAWGSYDKALHLVPRSADPGYPIEDIRLVLGKDGLPQKLFFREVTGDTVVFQFTKITRNPPGIAALTALHIPPGMEVIDASSTGSHGGMQIDKGP